MRPPNKSRSRNKNNRRNNNSGGNVLNRVYDSAGPDGRVRGTPVQVIEKYQALAHDHSLAGDRVAMENFQQHAEHYIRLINDAQRQMAERREQMEAQNRSNSGDDQNSSNQARSDSKSNGSSANGSDDRKIDLSQAEQPDIKEPKQTRSNRQTEAKQPDSSPEAVKTIEAENGGLVETPEGDAAKAKSSKPRRARRPKQESSGPAEEASAAE